MAQKRTTKKHGLPVNQRNKESVYNLEQDNFQFFDERKPL